MHKKERRKNNRQELRELNREKKRIDDKIENCKEIVERQDRSTQNSQLGPEFTSSTIHSFLWKEHTGVVDSDETSNIVGGKLLDRLNDHGIFVDSKFNVAVSTHGGGFGGRSMTDTGEGSAGRSCQQSRGSCCGSSGKRCESGQHGGIGSAII